MTSNRRNRGERQLNPRRLNGAPHVPSQKPFAESSPAHDFDQSREDVQHYQDPVDSTAHSRCQRFMSAHRMRSGGAGNLATQRAAVALIIAAWMSRGILTQIRRLGHQRTRRACTIKLAGARLCELYYPA